MASGWLIGGLQLIAGIILTATGFGAAIGPKLIVTGALSLISQALGGPGRTGFENSPTYGADGARNLTVLGAPLAMIFGECKYAPPVISAIAKTEGTKTTLYVLCALGVGEIDRCTDIKLNGAPLSSYPGAIRMIKRGTASQSATWLAGGGDDGVGGDVVVTGFGQIGRPNPVSTYLSDQGAGAGTHIHTMTDEADELWVELLFQSGLAHFNPDGSTKSTEWFGNVRVKPFGAADTQYADFGIPKNSAGKYVQGDFYQGKYGPWATSGNSRSAVRRTLIIPFKTRGRYVVKVEGFSDDDSDDKRVPTVVLITEIDNDSRAYAGTALLALKIPMTEQIQGQIPTITGLVRGIKLFDPRTGLTTWSRNPYLVLYYLGTNAANALGGELTSADFDAGVGGTLRALADRADGNVTPPGQAAEPRYELDLVIDTLAEAKEWFGQILSTCLSNCWRTQGTFKFSEEREYVATAGTLDGRRSAAAALSTHRILAGSLSVRQQPSDERLTTLLVKIKDRYKDHDDATIVIQDTVINVGAVTGGPVAAGTVIKGGTSKATARLTQALTNGDAAAFYVQDAGAAALQNGETITTVAGASCVASSAPYSETPERKAEIQLWGVTRPSHARRVGRAIFGGTRVRTLFGSLGVFLADGKLEPDEVIEVSHDRPAWTAKRLRVLVMECEESGRGQVQFREHADDPYALVDSADPSRYISPGGAVPSGLRAPSNTGSQAAPAGQSSSGGAGGSATTAQSSQASGATAGWGGASTTGKKT